VPTTLLSTALTTVERVKEQGSGIRSTDPTQDEAIRFCINSATTRILSYREFKSAAVGSTLRTFPITWQAGYADVNFGRYDAQTITIVTVNTQLGQTGTTLISSQYQPLPIGAPDGVFTSVRLVAPVAPGYAPTGVHCQASVTGTWGFPSVPPDVEHGCIETVLDWLHTYYQVPGEALSAVVNQLQLPARVQAMLGDYDKVRVE
jgi:hypothetical protein